MNDQNNQGKDALKVANLQVAQSPLQLPLKALPAQSPLWMVSLEPQREKVCSLTYAECQVKDD